MVNLIGRLPEPPAVLAVPGAHLHFYGKKPRAGRKLGHATVWADSAEEVRARLERLRGVVDLGEGR
jgi:5-(carboxyamino)imidazole ribonucleotide synthase